MWKWLERLRVAAKCFWIVVTNRGGILYNIRLDYGTTLHISVVRGDFGVVHNVTFVERGALPLPLISFNGSQHRERN